MAAYDITLVYCDDETDDIEEYEYTIDVDGWLACMAEAWAQRISPRDDRPCKVISHRDDA